MKWIVTINKDLCDGCKQCAEECTGEIYDIVDGFPVAKRLDDCHGCHICEEICPKEAINIEEGEDK